MRSLFEQFQQIQGSNSYSDNLNIALAELAGSKYSTLESMVVVSGTATISGMANVVYDSEVNNYINITAGNAAGLYQISSRVDANSVTVTPVPTGTDAAALGDRHYYSNLEDDLNYIRSALALITGESVWYSTPSVDLLSLSTHTHDLFKYLSDGTNQITASSPLDTVTFSGAGDISTHASPTTNVITISGVVGSTEVNWQLKTSNYLIQNGDAIIIDTTLASGIVLTSPPTPAMGDTFRVLDGGRNCGTVNATIDMNGKKIVGLSEDILLETDGAHLELVYYNTAQGWSVAN